MLKKLKVKKNKKTRIFDYLTPLMLLIGMILGFIEGGIFGCLIAIPLWLIALFGSLLGLVPVAGPFLYYFLIGPVLGYIATPFNLNVTVLVLFLYFLFFAILYTMISTLALIIVLWVKRAVK